MPELKDSRALIVTRGGAERRSIRDRKRPVLYSEVSAASRAGFNGKYRTSNPKKNKEQLQLLFLQRCLTLKKRLGILQNSFTSSLKRTVKIVFLGNIWPTQAWSALRQACRSAALGLRHCSSVRSPAPILIRLSRYAYLYII